MPSLQQTENKALHKRLNPTYTKIQYRNTDTILKFVKAAQ